jgi:hypothetical protein
MSEENIIQLVNKLNRNPNLKDCIKLELSKNVELAYIWSNNLYLPDLYFLIKENQTYVGAVFDMRNDLHWVILPKYRKKGHLSTALNQVILPYIFEELPRTEQKISIKRREIGEKNYRNSVRVALGVGFKAINEEVFVIDYKSIDYENIKLDYKYKGISDFELEKINDEIFQIAKQLNIIGTKIEFAFGREIEEYSKPSLYDTVSRIASLKMVFKDMQQDFKDEH